MSLNLDVFIYQGDEYEGDKQWGSTRGEFNARLKGPHSSYIPGINVTIVDLGEKKIGHNHVQSTHRCPFCRTSAPTNRRVKEKEGEVELHL